MFDPAGWLSPLPMADLQLCVRGDDPSLQLHRSGKQPKITGNVNAVMERSQLISVREVQPISEQNLAKIIPFATRVSNLAAFLQSAKAEQYLENQTLMEELVAKLPTSKRVDWVRHAATILPFPTVVHFSAWPQEYANVVFTVLDVEGKE